MAAPSAFEREYDEALVDLTFNSKPIIHALTMLAGEHKHHAGAVVAAISRRIDTAPPGMRLPALYLLDSIVKNIGEPFRHLFAHGVVQRFLGVYDSASSAEKASLARLLNTWGPVFPTEFNTLKAALLSRHSNGARPAAPSVPPVHAPAPAPTPALYAAHQPAPYANGYAYGAPPPDGYPHAHAHPGYGQAPAPAPAPHYSHPPSAYPSQPPAPMPGQPHAPYYGHGGYPQHALPPRPYPAYGDHAYPASHSPYPAPTPPPAAPPAAPVQPPAEQPKNAPAKKAAPKKTSFAADVLREYDENVVAALYTDFPLQCRNCALRFGDREELNVHMDWHFQVNKREKENKSTSRGWYLQEDAWTKSKGSEDLSVASDASPFFVASEENEEEEEKTVPADDEQKTCPVCEEKFDTSYDSDSDEWVYLNAIRSAARENKIVHVDCVPGEQAIGKKRARDPSEEEQNSKRQKS